MRVAFLGLGIMGQSMATNLVKAGHEVTVWNRTPGKLVEGASVAPNPAAAAQGAEVVWLCVSDTDAVEQVIFGRGRGQLVGGGRDHRRFEHNFTDGDHEIRGEACGQGSRLGGRANDRIEDWS